MPRCKNPNCKDKFKPRIFLQKFCLEKDECIKMAVEQKKGKLLCEKVKEMKVNTHSKEHKKELQKEINLLARMIDAKFKHPCIDCCGRPYGKQIDGAHFHSVGSNSSLRFNLHNIHSADSQCNNYSSAHLSGYEVGIKDRYGTEYLETLKGLPLKYKELKISNFEVYEKLAVVRKINRTFNTYNIINGESARELFNKLIGIYN